MVINFFNFYYHNLITSYCLVILYMNYQKIYNRLINKAKLRQNPSNIYIEVHHIIPRSIGGTSAKDNLVELTLREHYLAHELLVRIYPKCNELKYALWMMTVTTIGSLKNSKNPRGLRKGDLYSFDKNLRITSRQYEFAKEEYIKGKQTKTYTAEERNNVSVGTVNGMKSVNALKGCSKGSKNTKWYFNKTTKKQYKWRIGDPDIDLNIFSWGRPNLSEEEKEKISKCANIHKKEWYLIPNTNIVYKKYTEFVKCLPKEWIKVKKVISLHSIDKYLIQWIRQMDLEYNFEVGVKLVYLPDNKWSTRYNFVVPGAYEVLAKNNLLNYGNLDEDKIKKCLYENMDYIKNSTPKYLY